ncbi:hypothetical protein [Sphingosinicella sp.]|uniref:hypothetical protein n=1 Tax=Sphingosinicella sp. TaxID=1917971 RepID=UPI004037CA0C
MGHGGAFGLILGFVFGVPLLIGLAGLWRGRRGEAAASQPPGWDWRLLGQSSLLYTLAFNIIFFVQELFLVVPKALTPGLRPTLYHNNHHWAGDHPLERLFQGTGALAIFLTGLACVWLVHRGAGRTPGMRLFLIWMAFNGLFQSLPQVVVGAFNPGNDVSMAMDYLAMSDLAKTLAAIAALAGIAFTGLWITRPLLQTASDAARLASPGRRTGYMFNAATAPASLAVPVIILFRIPREAMEVVSPPIAVTLIGMAWAQANAWRVTDARPSAPAGPRAILIPLVLTLVLLAIFQLVLRPGIPFY